MTREQAIDRLAKSRRGCNAMSTILAWMDDDGLALDAPNQEAALSLIVSAWRQPGSTRDMIREAIERR